jgi:hypothetical protein
MMGNEPTYSVALTAAELVRLDGVCRDVVQKNVESAKRALAIAAEDVPAHIAALVAEALDVAESDGQLVLTGDNITSCHWCKRNDGYWPVQRTTRMKTKGRPDYDNPKTFRGCELRRSFIHIKNRVALGGCLACVDAALPVLNRHLKGVPCALPANWPNRPHNYERYNRMECTACGWKGHQGQMRKLPAMMGGSYLGGCPACPADNGLFSTRIKTADGFDLISATVEPAP